MKTGTPARYFSDAKDLGKIAYSFTHFKDMLGAKLKRTGHVTLPRPLGAVCLIYSTSIQNLAALVSKLKMDHVTLTTLLLGVSCYQSARS